MQVPPWYVDVFQSLVVISPPPYPTRSHGVSPLSPYEWGSVHLSCPCWVYAGCAQPAKTPSDWSPSLLSISWSGTCYVSVLRCSWWVAARRYRVGMGPVLEEWRVRRMCLTGFRIFPCARLCAIASCVWREIVCRWHR